MTNFYDEVIRVFKQDSRFFTENGTFLRNAAYEAVMQMDERLIKFLMKNEEIKRKFFKEIDGVYVFDKIKFGYVVNNKQLLPDSYTRFKNKIGLVDEYGKFIANTGKVELVFPYKDCVLRGADKRGSEKRRDFL